MQRRHALALTALAAASLAAAWGVASWAPGLRDRRLTPSAKRLMGAVAVCILSGMRPALSEGELAAHLDRLEQLVAALPTSTRAEISDLVGILTLTPGRWALAALADPWASASQHAVADALQGMRRSPIPVQRQAYQALRELTIAAHFSHPGAWSSLGYPGPKPV